MTVALFARVVRGLEWVAADEIAALAGASEVTVAARQVSFTLPELGPAVTALRVVDDVFVRVGVLRGVGRGRRTPDVLGRAVADLDVSGAAHIVRAQRSTPERPGLDVVASIDGDRRFNRYDIEDAIGLAIGGPIGAHYISRRQGRPPPSSLSLRVTLSDDRAEIGLRVATRPLHRRSWKSSTGRATLHPPAAAAMIRLAGPVDTLIDPFCGDGTIPVEAALSGAAAGVNGADLDRGRLAHARANAARAGVTVSLVRADAAHGPWRPAGATAWITNPPWARAVRAGGGLSAGLAPAWIQATSVLGPDGTLAVIADADLTVGDDLGAAGWRPVLTHQARLAGRVCRMVVAVPDAAGVRDPVSPSLRGWRERARRAGVITETGF